jgi:type IV pilus assembly protein PilX
MKHFHYSGSRSRQKGVVMAVMLILLLMVTVLGAALLHMQTAEQRISVNASNRSVAAADAEAALRYGECGLQGGCGGSGWSPTSFLQNSAGLFTLNVATGSTVTPQSPNTGTGATWAAPAGNTLGYAGAALVTSTVPQYVIEKLPPLVLPGDSTSQEQYNGGGGATPYQITAYANGADPSSRSVLQSTFRP